MMAKMRAHRSLGIRAPINRVFKEEVGTHICTLLSEHCLDMSAILRWWRKQGLNPSDLQGCSVQSSKFQFMGQVSIHAVLADRSGRGITLVRSSVKDLHGFPSSLTKWFVGDFLMCCVATENFFS